MGKEKGRMEMEVGRWVGGLRSRWEGRAQEGGGWPRGSQGSEEIARSPDARVLRVYISPLGGR